MLDYFKLPLWTLEHNRDSQFSTLINIELNGIGVYNNLKKSKSLLDLAEKNNAEFSILNDLKLGRSVTLTMDIPSKIKSQSGKTKKIVVIVPSALIAGPAGTFLIAVIGKGSAIINPFNSRQVGNLVIAGIPAILSNALIAEIRRVLK